MFLWPTTNKTMMPISAPLISEESNKGYKIAAR